MQLKYVFQQQATFKAPTLLTPPPVNTTNARRLEASQQDTQLPWFALIKYSISASLPMIKICHFITVLKLKSFFHSDTSQPSTVSTCTPVIFAQLSVVKFKKKCSEFQRIVKVS